MQSEMGPLRGIEQAVAAAVALFTQRLEAPIAVALEVIPRRVGVNEQGLGDLLCHPTTPKQHHRLNSIGLPLVARWARRRSARISGDRL